MFGTANAAPAELGQYNSLLKTIEANHNQPLEGFFYIAKDLEEAGAPAKTKGFKVEAKNNILDPHFVLELAKKRGTEDDIKFFETYSKFTDSSWPEPWHPYMANNEDDMLCIDTASPYLYDFYTGWIKYLGGFPTIEYIGNLDVYQSYATSQLDMYVFHLVKYDFCENEHKDENIDKFVEKLESNQDETNKAFAKRVVKAIKAKR